MDISLKDVAARLQHRTLDRFEMVGEEFHERVRQGYLEIARSSGGIILDATMKKDDLTKTGIEVVEAKIQEN